MLKHPQKLSFHYYTYCLTIVVDFLYNIIFYLANGASISSGTSFPLTTSIRFNPKSMAVPGSLLNHLREFFGGTGPDFFERNPTGRRYGGP